MKISVVLPTLGRKSLNKCLDSLKEADEIILLRGRKKCVVDLYNEGFKEANGDVIFHTSDRIFYNKGWRKKVEKALEKKAFVSFFQGSACSAVIKRDFIKSNMGGYLYWPEYIHYFGDMEMAEVARRSNEFVHLDGVAHWIEKKGSRVYPHEEERGIWDEETYRMRQNLGFPNAIVRDMDERKKLL